MPMDNLIEAVSNYVTLFLTENLSESLHFHTIEHTYEVVEASIEIGAQNDLSQEDLLILQVAAWFHDCGYANVYVGHEEESKKIAEKFLSNFGCEKDRITCVLNCIEATKFPQKPSSLLEKVLCDADLYHLTRTNYQKYEKGLRKEFEIYLGLQYSDEEWLLKNCQFLNDHQYCTGYGQQVLAKFKEVNIQLIHCRKYHF